MTTATVTPSAHSAVAALDAKIRTMRHALKRHAENGDTAACDALHSLIATLEEAAAILEGECILTEALISEAPTARNGNADR